MRSLDAAGDRAAAIRHARVHEQLLRNELGAEADPDVAAAAERLRLAPVQRAGAGNGLIAGQLSVDDRPVGIHEGGDPAGEPARGDVPIASGSEEPPSKEPPSKEPPKEESTVPSVVASRAAPVRKGRRMLVAASAIAVTCALLFAVFVDFRSRSASGIPDSVRAPSSPSVAVLPFVNVGGDPEQEYFSDGLTEELIAALSRVRSLRVAARTSAFAFKGEARDIREIGRSLSVGAVLEGSVLKDGDRVRVHAQLIDATNGFHLWSESYERRVADIFEIQTELALRITAALQTELTPAERASLERKPTESMEAHTAYLKGRYFSQKRSSGSFATAIGYFERAIAVDSNYARAYAGLASSYGPMGVHGFLPPGEARERMRSAVLRALKIDPDLAEARAALGNFRHTYEWDFVAAEKEYLRAIELAPDEPTSYTWYGFFLQSMQRFDEAIAQRRIATELDPRSPLESSGLGASLLFAGRTDLALETLASALELDSTYWQTHANIGEARLARGELTLAIDAFERAITHAGRLPRPRAGLAFALARAGRESEARQILARLRAEAGETGVHAPVVATVFVALREPDAALAWLEQAFQERHPDLPQTLARPMLTELHGDARFVDLKRRVGLIK
jgi:TolB-like protein/Flp pilus assembly protein TadD